MVKLTGPIQSLAASGSIAKAVTVSNWKGRQYLKRHETPRDPHSGAQLANRAMMRFLVEQWPTLTSANHQTWNQLAAQTNIAAYSAFLGHNLERFNRYASPTKNYPASEQNQPGLYSGLTPIITNRIHSVYMSAVCILAYQAWGYFIHQLATEHVTPSNQNIIRVDFDDDATADANWLAPIDPGTYWFATTPFSNDGVLAASSAAHEGTSLDY